MFRHLFEPLAPEFKIVDGHAIQLRGLEVKHISQRA